MFFGQVHYGHLLVPGQVENFTISTPLLLIPLCKLYVSIIGGSIGDRDVIY